MVAGWRGAWLAPAEAGVAPAEAEDRVRYRLLLLACIFCGIIQKPLITFAWDVQAFEDCLCDRCRATRQLRAELVL